MTSTNTADANRVGSDAGVLLRDVRPGEYFRDGNTECRMVGPHGANMHYEYRNSFGWQSAYMPWWHEVAKENQ